MRACHLLVRPSQRGHPGRRGPRRRPGFRGELGGRRVRPLPRHISPRLEVHLVRGPWASSCSSPLQETLVFRVVRSECSTALCQFWPVRRPCHPRGSQRMRLADRGAGRSSIPLRVGWGGHQGRTHYTPWGLTCQPGMRMVGCLTGVAAASRAGRTRRIANSTEVGHTEQEDPRRWRDPRRRWPLVGSIA